MSKNAKHRDYGGSSGTGETSNFQSQTAEGNAGPGPDDHRALDERIRRDVHERLAQHGGIDSSRVTVEVDGRHVVLRGTVNRGEDIPVISGLVQRVPGVKNVVCKINVR